MEGYGGIIMEGYGGIIMEVLYDTVWVLCMIDKPDSRLAFNNSNFFLIWQFSYRPLRWDTSI